MYLSFALYLLNFLFFFILSLLNALKYTVFLRNRWCTWTRINKSHKLKHAVLKKNGLVGYWLYLFLLKSQSMNIYLTREKLSCAKCKTVRRQRRVRWHKRQDTHFEYHKKRRSTLKGYYVCFSWTLSFFDLFILL